MMQPAEWKAWFVRKMEPILSRTSQQTKALSNRVWTYITNHKKQVVSVTVALMIGASGVAYLNHYYTVNTISIYHVSMNGREIGVVSSPDVVHKWAETQLAKAEADQGLTLKLSDFITFKEEQVYKGQYNNEATIAALIAEADIKVDAVKIIVNGETIGYAANQKEADEALAKVKARFADAPLQIEEKKQIVMAASAEIDKPTVKQVTFKESVTTQSGTVPAAQVLKADKLEELLSKGTYKDVTHTVQEGDCITCIAKQYGITSKDIYANNPGVTADTLLKLGQELNVTSIQPFVTVQVVEEFQQDEEISYHVQVKPNAKMPKGEETIVEQGKQGQKRVRYEVTKENGQEIERKVLDEEVIVEPVNKLIERGIKVIPSRGTGRLQWPAHGYVSSGFGMRWGRMHQGVDIAGSGTIRAADNGRVVQAGWNGNYGNSVTINHGNGIQTLYGHLRSISVNVGDVVSQGKAIGIMGSTGDSTGVHLHFEVHKNGRNMNPLTFLRR